MLLNMATQTPPPPRSNSKGLPPKIEEVRANLDKPDPGKAENLNFKVTAEFKRDFKIAAANRGLNQVELLQEIFMFWSQHHS
jgi:hypothetical protein